LQENEDYFLALKYYKEAPSYQPPIYISNMFHNTDLIDGVEIDPIIDQDNEISDDRDTDLDDIQDGLDEGVQDSPVSNALSYLMSEDLNNYEANLAIAEMIGDVGSGLSSEDIQKLPSFSFDSQNIEEQCSICLEKWEYQQRLKRLPCFHCFHENCVDQWLKKKNNCPLCLKQIKV